MKEERPFLQIPLPSPSDWHAYEEWARRQKEKTRDDEGTENVVIIEV